MKYRQMNMRTPSQRRCLHQRHEALARRQRKKRTPHPCRHSLQQASRTKTRIFNTTRRIMPLAWRLLSRTCRRSMGQGRALTSKTITTSVDFRRRRKWAYAPVHSDASLSKPTYYKPRSSSWLRRQGTRMLRTRIKMTLITAIIWWAV